MSFAYNEDLKINSQNLRKNMTPEEKHLWYDFLKLLPFTVKRQKIIVNYIVDFYIASKKIAIEIDGIQHEMPANKDNDEIRDQYLAEREVKVLRYTNRVLRERFDFVCMDILEHIGMTFEQFKPHLLSHIEGKR